MLFYQKNSVYDPSDVGLGYLLRIIGVGAFGPPLPHPSLYHHLGYLSL